jgi:Zn-dependent M28 family amino/carboxypeptidase
VNGDHLYNGALDDAAYVATLITFADARRGQGFRRPVIFAAVTAEEKGLWGSRWLAAHPTPAAPLPVAVLNLDQLRPLYPLRILTTLGLDDSTLGQTVRDIAGPMGIEVRPDLEPDRNLLRRTDHWPFMQRGVPAVSFLFGFDEADTQARARYRDWYENRYHAPQDDTTTPIDFEAQAAFHRFYFALAEAVANADVKPQWLPTSPNRPAGAN